MGCTMWMRDAGFGMQDLGCGMQDVDAGGSMQDVGCREWDAGCRIWAALGLEMLRGRIVRGCSGRPHTNREMKRVRGPTSAGCRGDGWG